MCSADYYDSDRARRDMVTPFLETILRHEIGEIGSPDGTFADGAIFFVQSGTQVPILLFESKNEIGSGDADATYEVGLLYRKYWSQKKVYHPSRSSGTHLPAH